MEGSERGDHLGGWTNLVPWLDRAPLLPLSLSCPLSSTRPKSSSPCPHSSPIQLHPLLISFVSLYTILEGKICLLDWFACLLAGYTRYPVRHFWFDPPPYVRGDIDGYTTYVLILLQHNNNNTTHCSFLSFCPSSQRAIRCFVSTLDSWLLLIIFWFVLVLIFGCYLWICGCGVGVVGVLRYNS